MERGLRMGEWSRARQSIHDAVNPEMRERAIDDLWKLARQSTVDDAVSAVDVVVGTQEEVLQGHDLTLVKMVGEFIKHEILSRG